MKRLFLVLLLPLLGIATALAGGPDDYCGDNVQWNLDETTHTLTIYGKGSTYDYYSSGNPFQELDFQKVVIKEGVTRIGEHLLRECKFTSIEIPNSVTEIGLAAFYGCRSLTSVAIPGRLITINNHTFSNCTSLKEVKLPNTVTSINDQAFYYCSSLSKINIPEGCQTIGANAFANSGLSNLILPTSLTSVADDAFKSCFIKYLTVKMDLLSKIYRPDYLQTVTLMQGTTSIPQSAFAGCTSLRKVIIPKGCNEISNLAFNECKLLDSIIVQTDTPPSLGVDVFPSSIYNNAKVFVATGQYNTYKQHSGWGKFVNIREAGVKSEKCGANVRWTLNESTGVLTISGEGEMYDYSTSDAPFRSITTIKSVIIEEGVTNIGKYFFYGNTCSIPSVDIPATVKSIGQHAFDGCSKLQTISLPNSLKEIGEYAFNGCEQLQNVTIPNSVTSIGNYTFKGCKAFTNACLPAHIETVPVGVFMDCTGILSATIPNSVKYVFQSSFENCTSLAEIAFPNSVTSIGNAFINCSGLRNIRIPATVKSMDNSAFENCDNYTDLTIPGELADKMYKSKKLFSLIIAEESKAIPADAFAGCSSLWSVVIPASCTSIADNAFADCAAIELIYCWAKIPPEVSASAFAVGAYSAATLYVPNKQKKAYEANPVWQKFRNINDEYNVETQCAAPTISFSMGKIQFGCATEGATFHYTLYAPSQSIETKATADDQINLTMTYTIAVYATASGYAPSREVYAKVDLHKYNLDGGAIRDADVNGDSIVNAADVVSIYNYIISGDNK